MTDNFCTRPKGLSKPKCSGRPTRRKNFPEKPRLFIKRGFSGDLFTFAHKTAQCAVSGGVTRYAVQELATVLQNGKRHFVRVIAMRQETGDPILYVWLWAKGIDISAQLTEEQRQQFLKELLPAGRS